MTHSWTPGTDSGKAFYIQIANHIRDLINSGFYAGGDKISERELAAQFGVSRNTVTRAFNILRDYGLLESFEKSGTIISDNAATLSKSADWHKFVLKSQHKNKKEQVRRFIQSNLDSYSSLNVWSPNSYEFGTVEILREVFRRVVLENIEPMVYIQAAQGLPQLREEIAKFVKHYDISVSVDDIFTFAGWQQALSCLAATVFSANTIVFLAEYDMIDGYSQFSYTPALVCAVSCDEEGIIPECFAEKLRRYKGKDRMLYIQPVNHIPTGRTMSARRMEELLSICRAERIPIIENDILRDVTSFDPPKPLRATEKDLVINLGAPGIFSQIGIKCSWLIVPETLRYKMAEIKMHMCGANHTYEIAAYEMFKDGYYSDIATRVRSVCDGRNKLINAALREHLGPYATWVDDESVYRLITFNEDVSVDEAVFEHNDIFNYINIFSLRQHLVLDLVSHTVEDIIANLAFIRENLKIK